MVKFAKVGYGSDGRGIGKTTDGYTYVVNDNVRAQDIIYPSAFNIPAQRIIGTTGKVLSTAKEMSVKGQKIKQELDSGGANGNKEPINPAYVMTTKEAGAKPERGQSGKFISSGEDAVSAQGKQTRKANVEAREVQGEKQSGETFESYSARFIQDGRKGGK